MIVLEVMLWVIITFSAITLLISLAEGSHEFFTCSICGFLLASLLIMSIIAIDRDNLKQELQLYKQIEVVQNEG
jgi:hypothetical protein